ncbi:MAG: sigma-54-dependent Fis family transcriptional regulator [Candidatus Eisenbacteria sp.]|nr:sigma-54-dependent Fis family transcriptional regulator [Candidatus Eisenbacteria bacterium]
MNGELILERISPELARAERDLAVGNRKTACRRATAALAELIPSLNKLEPELSAWLRILADLAGADRSEGPSIQRGLWPELEKAHHPSRKLLSTRAPSGKGPGGVGARLITQDERMLTDMSRLRHLAPTDLPIFIEGDSGTGKEVVARTIHQMSERRGKPWVAVNCGAIPSQLQESELFGHTRGAYTGATVDRQGLFEAAHEGTLFLDEVAEMDSTAQVKLLRVLETGELRRLGEVRTRWVNVRIIAATNADVNKVVAAGRFRKDLLFRLGAVRLRLPALAERRGDILPLAEHFIRKVSSLSPSLTPAAQMALVSHDWPGNVRELKFVIERALALWVRSDELEITAEMLCAPLCYGSSGCLQINGRAIGPAPDSMTAQQALLETETLPEGQNLDSFLGKIEHRLIEHALQRAGGNRTLAARFLGGLSRTTLIGKMKRLGLFKPAQAAGAR